MYGQKPMRYDGSHVDTSSYQSYETPTLSSGLAGNKEKEMGVSTGPGGPEGAAAEQHMKAPGATNGVTVADVPALDKEKLSTEDQRLLPKQAYVEPSKDDHGKPSPVVKPAIGSPAGDSTYASPIANIASPADSHNATEPQPSESISAREMTEGKSILQASKVDSAVGLPGSTQYDRKVDVYKQALNQYR